MFRRLNNLLSQKCVVGLETDGRFMRAVRIVNPSKGPEIDRIAVREVKEPENFSEELRVFLHDEHLKDDMVISCLSASKAFIRQFPLLFDNPKKLDEIIKYQTEPYTPHNVDDLIVDYLEPGPGGEVATVSVLKKDLAEHLANLSMAGLEPEFVSIDDIALYFLYRHAHNGKSQDPLAIINFCREKVTVLVIYDGRLDFIRVIPGGSGDLETFRETFNVYRLKNREMPLSEIRLTGLIDEEDHRTDALQAGLNIKTSLWRPFDGIKHKLGEIPDSLQARMSVSLGLALSASVRGTKVFDLRREEFSLHQPVNLKGVSLLLLSLLLVVGLFSFSLFYDLSQKEAHLFRLQGNMRRLFLEAFPEATHVIKGRELAQFSQRIEKEMGENNWLQGATDQGRILDILLEVSKSMAGFSDVIIDNFSVEGTAIRLDGHTSSFETVDRLEKKLGNSGFFKAIKLMSAKMDQREKSVKFNFAIQG